MEELQYQNHSLEASRSAVYICTAAFSQVSEYTSLKILHYTTGPNILENTKFWICFSESSLKNKNPTTANVLMVIGLLEWPLSTYIKRNTPENFM